MINGYPRDVKSNDHSTMVRHLCSRLGIDKDEAEVAAARLLVLGERPRKKDTRGWVRLTKPLFSTAANGVLLSIGQIIPLNVGPNDGMEPLNNTAKVLIDEWVRNLPPSVAKPAFSEIPEGFVPYSKVDSTARVRPFTRKTRYTHPVSIEARQRDEHRALEKKQAEEREELRLNHLIENRMIYRVNSHPGPMTIQ